MKNLSKIFLLCTGLFFNTSCGDLEDVNKNPNDPEIVPVDRFIVGVQRNISETFTKISLDITSKFIQQTEWPLFHWTYNLESSMRGEDFWITYFNELRNVDYIIENAGEGYEDYKGMALTVRSWMDYVLTSCYGDIPYSEADKAKEEINTPKYDAQSDVFKTILNNLEEANKLLGSGNFALNGDFLLNNDALKWKKFANSLHIRVLIAQSNQIDPTSELKRIVGNPDYPIMESIEDQPALTYLQSYTYPYNSSNAYYTQDTYICKTLVDKLLKNNDDRIKLIASQTEIADEPYVGIPSGQQEDPAEGTASKISPFIFLSRDNFALQTVWMNYSEVAFLLAEAAEKGWIDGGSSLAKQYYEEGIKASYEYCYKIQQIGIEQGTGTFNVEPMRKWDSSYLEQEGVAYEGNKEEKLELIAGQKWIALYNDIENWFSYRRSNLPTLEINADQPNEGIIPLRFKYPENEKAFNTNNYNEAVKVQGSDTWETRMWIIK